jgi:hypothetical protein
MNPPRQRLALACALATLLVPICCLATGCFFVRTKPTRLWIIPQHIRVVSKETGLPLDNVTVQVNVYYYCEAALISIHSHDIDSYLAGPFPGDSIEIPNRTYFRPPCLVSGFNVEYTVSAPGSGRYKSTDALPSTITLDQYYPDLQLLGHRIVHNKRDNLEGFVKRLTFVKKCKKLPHDGFYNCAGLILQLDEDSYVGVVRVLGKRGEEKIAEELLKKVE